MINSCGSTQWLRQLAAIRGIRRTDVTYESVFHRVIHTNYKKVVKVVKVKMTAGWVLSTSPK